MPPSMFYATLKWSSLKNLLGSWTSGPSKNCSKRWWKKIGSLIIWGILSLSFMLNSKESRVPCLNGARGYPILHVSFAFPKDLSPWLISCNIIVYDIYILILFNSFLVHYLYPLLMSRKVKNYVEWEIYTYLWAKVVACKVDTCISA